MWIYAVPQYDWQCNFIDNGKVLPIIMGFYLVKSGSKTALSPALIRQMPWMSLPILWHCVWQHIFVFRIACRSTNNIWCNDDSSYSKSYSTSKWDDRFKTMMIFGLVSSSSVFCAAKYGSKVPRGASTLIRKFRIFFATIPSIRGKSSEGA